jgi:hypothetical protein
LTVRRWRSSAEGCSQREGAKPGAGVVPGSQWHEGDYCPQAAASSTEPGFSVSMRNGAGTSRDAIVIAVSAKYRLPE